MLQVKLTGTNEVERFIRKNPSIIKQSIKETVGFAVNKITRSTAKDTGAAQSGWRSKALGVFEWIIFNVFDHAWFLEEGTGLLGPLKKRIKPKNAKVLAWSGVSGNTQKGIVFAASTKGMKAQPAIKPNIRIIEKDLVARARLRIRRLWSATR